ncbi:MAG: hypothetical protein OEM62_06340 [Acidobacteriota bacterium]|nr:hypothetical protein [Acidobacteriota bacterium]
MKAPRSLIALTLVAQTLLAQAPEPTLEVDIDAEEILVGDLVGVELRTIVSEGIEPVFPHWEETWGEAEIRQVGPIDSHPVDATTRQFQQSLTVAFFSTGEIVLPNPRLTYSVDDDERLIAPAAPIAVTVASVLEPGEEIPRPRPPALPRSMPWGETFVRTTALLAFLSLVAMTILARTRHRTIADASVPPTPLAALEAALDKLRGESDPAIILTALSIHLRRFFGTSLAFPGAESTTTELRRRLLERRVPLELVKRIEQLMRDSDGIKFARRPTTRQAAESGLAEAAMIATATTELVHGSEGDAEEAPQ